jgi:tRNA dimethylallyltransferase
VGLIAIVGPTAVGKTAVAVAVARRLGNAELINADSRQILRGLSVGTCAPAAAELAGVPGHLLAVSDPGESFTVADWVAMARTVIADIESRGLTGIVVGGSGLYIDALVDGFQVAGGAADPQSREQRRSSAASEQGLAALVGELRARDPTAAEDIDLRNPRRVIRALEILDAGAGTVRDSRCRTGGLPARVIGIDADRETHERLITARSETMVHGGGLLSETRAALARGVSREALRSSGIGYAEALALLDGQITRERAVEAITARTRRYAKAQRTWFRHRVAMSWLDRASEGDAIADLATKVLSVSVS